MQSEQVFNKAWELLKERKFQACEVIDTDSRLAEMQIDAGDISLMRTTLDRSVSIRALRDHRYASIAMNQVTDSSIESAVEALDVAAQNAPVDEARVCIGPEVGGVDSLKHGPQREELEPMYHRMQEFLTTAKKDFPDLKLEQSGLTFRSRTSRRINSSGLTVSEQSGEYQVMAMFSSKRGEKTSSFNYTGVSLSRLERPLIEMGAVRRLLESSVRELDHAPLKGKFVGRVIVAPECVLPFLFGGILGHLGDSRVIAGTSRLADQVGERVLSREITLRADVEDESFAERELFTSDGYRARSTTLFENGVLKSLLLSEYGARKSNRPRGFNGGSNLVLEPGAHSLDQMIAQVERGILVGRFSGGDPAANGDISGVAKNSYLIENGKVVGPISEAMLSGNLFTMMNSVFGLSKEVLDDGSSRMPYVGVDQVTVSGVD